MSEKKLYKQRNCAETHAEYEKKFTKIMRRDGITYNLHSELRNRCIPYDNGEKEIIDELPSITWMDAQAKYIQNLDDRSRKYLELYTKHGDKILNDFLRNDFSFIYNNSINDIKKYHDLRQNISQFVNVEDFLIDFYYHLNIAIANSPMSEKEFVVYRGQTDTPKKRIYQGHKYIDTDGVELGDIYNLRGMYSTDILTSNTMIFGGNKHLLKIIIPRNLPCLSLISLSHFNETENEILLCHNSVFRVVEAPTIHIDIERTTFEYINFNRLTSIPIAKTKTPIENVGIASKKIKYDTNKLETGIDHRLYGIMIDEITTVVYNYISGTKIRHGYFYSEIISINGDVIQQDGNFKMGEIESLRTIKNGSVGRMMYFDPKFGNVVKIISYNKDGLISQEMYYEPSSGNEIKMIKYNNGIPTIYKNVDGAMVEISAIMEKADDKTSKS